LAPPRPLRYEPQALGSSLPNIPRRPIPLTFVTVWKQDFRESERIPMEAVAELMSIGVVKSAWKPNKKGKLKPVLVSLDVMSKIRDLSSQMGPSVIWGNATGSQHHKSIVDCWAR
jgi:hypothetical protein